LFDDELGDFAVYCFTLVLIEFYGVGDPGLVYTIVEFNLAAFYYTKYMSVICNSLPLVGILRQFAAFEIGWRIV
jgi:hypothetical protein